MRTYWSAIFSSAKVVRRVLYVWWRKVFLSHKMGGFTVKEPGGRKLVPTSEDLSQLLDVLAAYQGMSDRRRLLGTNFGRSD